jgi:hypothetical protein
MMQICCVLEKEEERAGSLFRGFLREIFPQKRFQKGNYKISSSKA